MDTNRNRVGSHLFLVRLWLDPDGADEAGGAGGAGGAGDAVGDGELSGAWHGTVQHVLTGKAASFDDRAALTDILFQMMPRHRNADAAPPENGATK